MVRRVHKRDVVRMLRGRDRLAREKKPSARVTRAKRLARERKAIGLDARGWLGAAWVLGLATGPGLACVWSLVWRLGLI